MSKKTFFGFKEVDAEDKASMVHGVFSSVAKQYDVMNDVMSAGVHRLWKNTLIRDMNPKKGSTLLDVAGGTGDIAFRFLEANSEGEVIVCDINESMVREGHNNAIDRGIVSGVHFVVGDAEALEFPDNAFDYYTIAFGIRNVTNIDQALREAYRVLKPRGQFFCLEFSHVKNPVLARIYDTYSFHMIPQFGQWITGDKDSYQYLVESIRQFPDQDSFAKKIEDAGFSSVSYQNLTHGVVAIHKGYKT